MLILLEVTDDSLKPEYFSTNRHNYAEGSRDLLIITMRRDGTMIYAYDINFGRSTLQLFSGSHCLFAKDSYHIFAGWSYGFKTRY